MHIELSVSGQRLRREMGPGIVGGSRYYLTAHVAFAGHDWDGCQVWLKIDQACAQNAYLLDADGCVTADRGINLPAGQYDMSLLGLRDDVRITTNVVPLCVLQSGADSGKPLPEVAQTVAEQIAALAQQAADTASALRADADAGRFDGAPGKDGVSATHQWDGTVLSITSASGTSSADLRGPKGETGPQGERGETGAQGAQGEPGRNGLDAPQDAVRYGVQALTDEQQQTARGNIGAASGEEVSSLKSDLTNLVEHGKINLVSQSTVIEGKQINLGSGNLGSFSIISTIDYMPIESNKEYSFKRVRNYAFYDESKVYIANGSGGISQSEQPNFSKITTPETAKFLRVDYIRASVTETTDVKVFLGDAPETEGGTKIKDGVDVYNDIAKEKVIAEITETGSSIFATKPSIMSVNLFDKINVTKGKGLDASGNIITKGGYYVSDFIKVETNNYYAWNIAGVCYALYNSSKKFIRYVSGGGSDRKYNWNVLVNDNETYIRFDFVAGANDTLVFANGKYAYPFYVPFGLSLDNYVVNDYNAQDGSYPYRLKNWACVGDSFIDLGALQPLLMKKTNMYIAINDGVTGRVVGAMAEHLTAENMADIDIITILGGTNDFGAGSKPLGSVDDLATTSFAKDVNDLITTIYTLKSDVIIMWIAPCQRFDKIQNSLGLSIFDYVDTIKSVCGLYGIPVYDMSRNVQINKINYSNFLNADKLHPAGSGWNLIANGISGFINTH